MQFIKNLLSAQPLTLRGLLALALAIVALRFFAVGAQDLIAYVVGGGILALVFSLVVLNWLLSWKLKNKISIDARFEQDNALSNSDIPAGIILRSSWIPPFFQLRVSRVFDHLGVKHSAHLLAGLEGQNRTRHLIDNLLFEHRGLWTMTALSCSLQDALGFTSVSWNLRTEKSIEISAPTISIRPLPIVAASSRAGDELQVSQKRTGDPFDIKQYDPSDGITRILWKTFAKSGELVVRRPEPAVIPEGEVALYCIASKDEDYVVGALQSYLDQLFENDITVLFGTDGSSKVSTSMEDIRHAINYSVWNKDTGTGRGFDSFLSELESMNRPVHRAVVFTPSRDNWLQNISTAAANRNVQLSIVMVPTRFAQTAPKRTSLNADSLGSQITSAITGTGGELIVCESYELAA